MEEAASIEEVLSDILSYIRSLRNWPKLGEALGLEQKTLEAISVDNRRESDYCKRDIVLKWISTRTCESPSTLKKEICKIAGQIMESEKVKKNTHNPVIPLALLRKYLMARYKNATQQCPLPLPSGGPVLPYTQPALVAAPPKEDKHKLDLSMETTLLGDAEKILTTRKKCTIQSIFDAEGIRKGGHSILITGSAGIGKSCLANRICFEWSQTQNTSLSKFQAVLLVSLKEFNVDDNIDLKQVISSVYHGSGLDQVVGELSITKGLRTLIILDGWDELPEAKRQSSIFVNLLMHRVLPRATVLVTSRPYACSKLHVDHHFEIFGFTRLEITRCINGVFNDSPTHARELLEYLEGRPVISGLCFCPLHLLVVVALFKFSRHKMPATLTELYKCLVETLLLINAERSGTNKDMGSGEFSALCEIAFTGIVEEKLSFDLEFTTNLKLSLPVDSSGSVHGLGLLHSATHVVMGMPSTRFFFNHLSLQEFLAAWHLHTLPHDRQLELLKRYYSWSAFCNVCRFHAGLTGLCHQDILSLQCQGIRFHNTPLEKTTDVCYYARYLRGFPLEADDYVCFNKREELAIIQHLYEARNVEIVKRVATKFGNTLNLRDSLLSHTDCQALGYFIALSDQEWRLYLQWAHTDSLVFQNIQLGCKEAPHGHTGTIRELCIAGLTAGADALQQLDCESPIFCNLQTVWLSGSCVGPQGTPSVVNSLGRLHQLELSKNSIGDDGAKIIAEHLRENKTLCQLSLTSNEISADGAGSLAEALESNTCLQSLFMSSNPLGSEGIRRIATAALNNTHLAELSVAHCGGDPSVTMSLVELIMTSESLVYLDISSNDLDNHSAHELALACVQSKHLKTLMVMGNHFNDDAIQILDEASSENISICTTKRPSSFKFVTSIL